MKPNNWKNCSPMRESIESDNSEDHQPFYCQKTLLKAVYNPTTFYFKSNQIVC